MRKVEDLRSGWDQEKASEKAAAEKKSTKNKAPKAPDAADDDLFPEEDEQPVPASTENLFDDSDDSDVEQEKPKDAAEKPTEGEEKPADGEPAAETTQQDLFGDSSDDESDEELVPSGTKRGNEAKEDEEDKQPTKKRKVFGDDDDSD
jgi:hypothetical protein